MLIHGIPVVYVYDIILYIITEYYYIIGLISNYIISIYNI